MLNQAGASKTDTLVKLVLVFFIALLSFSIGTFVGKKFSDNQHILASLENGERSGERGLASIPPDASDVRPNDALKDDEIAKLAEEFVTDDEGKGHKEGGHSENESHDAKKAENEHGEKAHDETASRGEANTKVVAHGEAAHGVATHDEESTPHGKKEAKKAETHTVANAHGATAGHEKEVNQEIQKIARRMVEGRSPTEPEYEAEKSRLPSSLPKNVAQSAIDKWTVQVASYASEIEAKGQAENLKKKGLSAGYVEALVNGKTWFRVTVGLFATKDEAVKYRSEVLAKSGLNAAIIQKINR
jgi:cell division protein FtsN